VVRLSHASWSNKPDAVNPAIASRFHASRPWRGVADPGRSAELSSAGILNRRQRNGDGIGPLFPPLPPVEFGGRGVLRR